MLLVRLSDVCVVLKARWVEAELSLVSSRFPCMCRFLLVSAWVIALVMGKSRDVEVLLLIEFMHMVVLKLVDGVVMTAAICSGLVAWAPPGEE